MFYLIVYYNFTKIMIKSIAIIVGTTNKNVIVYISTNNVITLIIKLCYCINSFKLTQILININIHQFFFF